MSDIEKIRILRDINSNFDDGAAVVKNLKEQIKDNNLRANFPRFTKGFTAEDYFSYVFSAMPWVKLIHALSQKQYPDFSKEVYQVPDFMLYFENNKIEVNPILVEVKSVNEKRFKLKLMDKQVNNLLNYSNIIGHPLIFATYWSEFRAWTLNSIEVFKKKSSGYVLDMFDAIKNDVSIILGDLIFMFHTHIYRLTLYDSNNNNEITAAHRKWGTIVEEKISIDNVEFLELEPGESAVIDAFLKMKEIDVKKGDSSTLTLEVVEDSGMPRFSHLIMRYLGLFNNEYTEKYCLLAAHIINNLTKKIQIKNMYILPNQRNKTYDTLMSQAFSGSHVLDSYLKGYNV